MTHVPTLTAPEHKVPLSYRHCHMCKKALGFAVVPVLTLADDQRTLFHDNRANILFCWNCFDSLAGKEWGVLLLKKGLEIQKDKLGSDHDLVKSIETEIEAYANEDL